jgi:predicted RND superfamily exporter protein
MINKIASFILRNRPLVVIVFVLLTTFMGIMGSRVKLSYDNQKLVPKDDKDFIEFTKFAKTFGDDGNKMVFGFKHDNVFEANTYAKLYETCEKISAINGVKEIISPARFYNLNKNDEIAKFEFKRVPTSFEEAQNHSDSLKEVFESLGFYKNMLTNPSTGAVLGVISMDGPMLNTDKRIPLIDSIKSELERFGSQLNISMHLSGLPYVKHEFATMVKGEFLKFTFLSIGVTAIFLLLFFRSFVNILIPIFLVGISVVWSLGIIGILGYKLTILTGIIPPLMVVIGIPNSIYLINRYHAEFRKHGNKIKALNRIISKVGPANLLTNFTTAVGFGVFYFTKTTLLVQFGVVTFCSILAVSVVTVVLLPVIYSYLPAPSLRQTKHLSNKNINTFIEKVHHIVFNKRRVVYFFSFVLIIISLLGLIRLRPLVFVVDDIPQSSRLNIDLKFFEENFKGIMPLEIIIDTGEEDGLKNTGTLQRISTFQKRIEEFENVGRPVSVVDLLSFANQTWHDGNPRYYRLPNKTTLGNISNYFGGNGTETFNNTVTDASYRKARISLQIADIGSEKMEVLANEIQKELSDIFPKEQYSYKITGTSYLFMVGNRYLVKSLFQSVLIAFILIAIIMGSLFTSFKMILVSLIPNMIPMLITAGIMGLAGIPLKPSTILVFSIAFGIAIDDTIHFLAKFRQELKHTRKPIKKALSLTLEEIGTSLIYTSVILFFGFIMFGFSDFQGTVALGVLTSIALFFALFSNIFVLPSLILSYEKRLNPRLELKESVLEFPNEDED